MESTQNDVPPPLSHRPLALPPMENVSFEDDMWSNIFAEDEAGAVGGVADGGPDGPSEDSKASSHDWHHLSSDDDDDHRTNDHQPPVGTPEYWTAVSLSQADYAPSHVDHQPPPNVLLSSSGGVAFETSPLRYPLVVIPVATTALSKPLCRFDGLVVVGTDGDAAVAPGRLVLSNFRSPNPMAATTSLPIASMVRDLQWVNPTIVAVAVGKDIQLVQVGAAAGVDSATTTAACFVGAPITMAHSNAIREMAVPPLGCGRDGCILSGGFDETVCVTDLEKHDVLLKFDARNVVSSVRWMPGEASHVSWTTDGGMFSIADLRVRSSTGQINFDSALAFGHVGGLYSHDYVSPTTVVVGYESGHVACLDLRKPSKESCFLVCKTPLTSVGEVRKCPATAECALFGAGGFSLVHFHATTPDTDQWHISFASKLANACQTSGDFAMGDPNLMAVSDSAGMVSLYDVSTSSATTASLHSFGDGLVASPRSHAMSF
ncbi:hypothetical protein H257_13643 [Aphanomyces astaci]|uniref:Anaphase-promoting complex subunit 4 WD40 domain-containing protein n=1 Tax=Aphanomyces astaci TaxID=112090 RepID=W4FV86_APHAT|nr:hypothetical protein H257_13643 [Aphanomyces astaci]ETV70866.1 hypothetical protein H257_13643 [Aphanomyces astaci]|eukprot:XP_009839529.1 hypothetical protein H257_13643 [Aphanomyces astaci]